MTLYPETHAICLHERAYKLLDSYSKVFLDNEITPKKWRSIFHDYFPTKDFQLPDSAELSWEELDYTSLDIQIDLFREEEIYCTKEVILLLWGIDLVAIYCASPNKKNLNKLFFATELICYAEASLATTLLKNHSSHIQNRFTFARKKERKEVQKSERMKIREDELKKNKEKRREEQERTQLEKMTEQERENWRKRKENEKKRAEGIAHNYARLESYFLKQGNFIKYWRKIPLYKVLIDCFFDTKPVKAFLEKPDSSDEVFDIDDFLKSEELNKKLRKLAKQEKLEKKTYQEASKLIESGSRFPLIAPTEKLIELLPYCIEWATEDGISPKDVCMRELKGGALYKLTPPKKKKVSDSPSSHKKDKE